MKRMPFLIILLWCCSLAAEETYNLQDILSSASQKTDELEIIDAEYEAGTQQVNFYRAEAYPFVTLSSGAGYGYQSIEALKSSMDAGPGQYRPENGSQNNDTGASSPAPPGNENTHQGAYQMNWNLSLRQPLFTFGKVTGALALAKVQGKILAESKQLQTDLYYLSVTQAFSTNFLAQENVLIAQKTYETAHRLLQRMKIESEGGAVSKLELLRIEGRMRKAEADLHMAKAEHDGAMRRLARLADLELDTNFILSFSDADNEFSIPAGENVKGNTEYELKELQGDFLEKQLKIERSGFFPSVYLAGSVNNNQTFHQDSSIESKNLFNPDHFNYTIGVQLTWNIFDGMRTLSRYRQVRADQKRVSYELNQVEEKKTIAVQETRDALVAVAKSREAVTMQKKAAARAFTQAEEDFQNGYVSATDLLEIEQELRRAEFGENQLHMQELLTIAQLKLLLGIPLYGETEL